MKLSTGMIVTIASGIVAIGAAASTIDHWRPVPWISEFRLAAGEAYKASIRQNFEFLLLIQEAVRKCKEEQSRNPNAPSCIELLQQEQNYKQTIEELKLEQKKVAQ